MKKTKLFWALTFFLMMVNLILYLTAGEKALPYISDSFPIVCSLIAIYGVYCAFRVLKTCDFAKISWLFLLIGLSLNFLAESIYAILEIFCSMDMNEIFPSLADYFWCSGYIAFFISVIVMFAGYKKSGFPLGKIKVYALLSLLFTLLSLAVIYLLLIPIINDGETKLISKVFYLYYPIADILIVSMALILLYIISQFGKGLITMPWKMLALGFFCFAVSDLLYSYLGWKDAYGNGNLIDMGWHLGYLLIGLSGLYQRELIVKIKRENLL